MDHMAECVIHDRIPYTPGEEGLQDQKLMALIYQAAHSRQTITLPPVSGLNVTRGPLHGCSSDQNISIGRVTSLVVHHSISP